MSWLRQKLLNIWSLSKKIYSVMRMETSTDISFMFVEVFVFHQYFRLQKDVFLFQIWATMSSNQTLSQLTWKRVEMHRETTSPTTSRVNERKMNSILFSEHLSNHIANNEANETRILLGNDTICTLYQGVCNGPLQENANFKFVFMLIIDFRTTSVPRILIGGCVRGECTHVLSNQYQTG